MIIKREKMIPRCTVVTSTKRSPTTKESAESYRTRMLIKDSVICHGKVVFHLCPRCKAVIPRDMVPYCDQCGQHLDWSEKDSALPAAIFQF